MEFVHVLRPAFTLGELSSVILSPCTCRYKLLNQPHHLALATYLESRRPYPTVVYRPHRVQKHEPLNKSYFTAGNVIWKNGDHFRFEEQWNRNGIFLSNDAVGSSFESHYSAEITVR